MQVWKRKKRSVYRKEKNKKRAMGRSRYFRCPPIFLLNLARVFYFATGSIMQTHNEYKPYDNKECTNLYHRKRGSADRQPAYRRSKGEMESSPSFPLSWLKTGERIIGNQHNQHNQYWFLFLAIYGYFIHLDSVPCGSIETTRLQLIDQKKNSI